MKDTIKKIITAILIFGIYFAFPYIIELLIDIFKIDLNSWKHIYKMIFIYSIDLLPLLFLIVIYKDILIKDFKDFKSNWKEYFEKYFKYWILGVVVMVTSNSLISIITSSTISNNEKLIREIVNILPIYSIITTCICAPIAEELAYRKTLDDIFRKKWVSIIIGALFFGGAHIIGTYTKLGDILYIIPYGFLGGIFMYIYNDSKNIWNTISLHFIHNTLMLTLYIISIKL